MDGEEQTRARIDELRAEISERLDELDELIAQLPKNDGAHGRRRFTVIEGGWGALALPIGAVMHRPRHQVALTATAAAAGALAAVLAVPGHTRPGAGADATSDLSIPWAPPWSTTATASTTPPPAATQTTPSPPAPAAPVATGSASTAPSSSPSAPGPRPTTSSPSTIPPPTLSPTPPNCLITLGVDGLLDVCLL